MFAWKLVFDAYLGIDQWDAKDVGEEKKDLVFGVVLRRRSDICIDAIDLLYFPLRGTLPSNAWRLLMSTVQRGYD